MVAPPAPAWVRWAKRRRPESGPAPPPAETASLERKIPFQLSAQLWTRGPGEALMSAKARTHTSVTASAEPSEAPTGSKLPKAGRKNDAPLPAGLYLVEKTIGKLGDRRKRALDVLRRANRHDCE